ncbi:hypothetical protein FB451DRAFT_1185545 [Mycena latifolia]|nr:hypothetical protein FB451DRAFT_1185545 [Mycena latifolia]
MEDDPSAAHTAHRAQMRHMSRTWFKLGTFLKRQCADDGHQPAPPYFRLSINPAATRPKRAKMPSRHAPADEKLIDSLPMGTITAFRSSIYLPTYATSNAHLFITNDWIDAEQLCQFLKRIPDPDRDAPPPESPPARVKLEDNASATRLSASEDAIPPVDFPSVITRIPNTHNSMDIDFSFFQQPDSGTQFSVPPSTSLPRLPPIPASSPISPTPEPVTAHVDQVSATGSKNANRGMMSTRST